MNNNNTSEASRDAPEIPQLFYTTLEGADGCRVILPMKAAENSRLLKHLLKGLAVLALEQHRKGSMFSDRKIDHTTTSEGQLKKETGDSEEEQKRNVGDPENTYPFFSSLFLPPPSVLSSPKNHTDDAVEHPKGLEGRRAMSHHKSSDDYHDNHGKDEELEEDRFHCFAAAPCTNTAVRHANRRACRSSNERDQRKSSDKGSRSRRSSNSRDSSPPVGHSSDEGETSSLFFPKFYSGTPGGNAIIAQVSSAILPLPTMSFRTLCEVAEYLVFSLLGKNNSEEECNSSSPDEESKEFSSHTILHSMNMDSTEDRKEVKRILLAADFFQC